MFQKQRESVWNWFCFLILLVQLCAPFLFPVDDDDPDPADECEGGQEAVAFSFVSIVVPSNRGLIRHDSAAHVAVMSDTH